MAKICHITSAHQPGDIRIFHKECSTLAAAGFDVFLVVPWKINEVKNGVTIIGAGLPDNLSRRQRLLGSAGAVWRKARSLNADIYHFHDPDLLRYAGKMTKTGAKVIYDSHEDLPRQVKSKYYIPGWMRDPLSRYLERYENKVVRRIWGVVAATPLILKRFKQVNPNTVTVCNYPLLVEFDKDVPWTSRRRQVAYLGSITRVRGIVELVQAMEHVDAQLVLAGLFSPASLRDEVKQLPGWKKVKELGFVDRGEVASILAESKVGVVTLYPQDNYRESLPIKLFEYMAAGVPVVASDFPLWKAIVEGNQCGVCANPQNAGDIAAALQKILSDDEGARIMGRNGRRAVLEMYNWHQEGEKLVKFYKKALEVV
ncbi:MAG: glycosyltransferase family 4 protein [Flavobacteriales bacterium]|nr:glycosyltransferase family 4 protein [Flavobacteriales bacterium]MCB9447729.1 glycosyltransferase family 4 protein [Flavobacteriales bacterium]